MPYVMLIPNQFMCLSVTVPCGFASQTCNGAVLPVGPVMTMHRYDDGEGKDVLYECIYAKYPGLEKPHAVRPRT